MGKYVKYTRRAAVAVTLAVVLSVVPYFLLYQIIAPLVGGAHLAFSYVMLRVLDCGSLSWRQCRFVCAWSGLKSLQRLQYIKKSAHCLTAKA